MDWPNSYTGFSASQADPGCLEFDNRWPALTIPHLATQFFCVEPLPPFEVGTKNYHPVNARWLCEVSRIIYKEEKGPLQNQSLNKGGLKETEFFDGKGIQCVLIESQTPAKPFSILVVRGTRDVTDWFKNLDVKLIGLAEQGRVRQFFFNALMQVWPKLEPKLHPLKCERFAY